MYGTQIIRYGDLITHSQTQPAVFHLIHNACNSVYHSLHASTCKYMQKKRSPSFGSVVSWEQTTPLQMAVFYYVGKRFYTRGGEEQRCLGPSQFIHSSNPNCITYFECGTLKDLRYENKEVPCPALPDKQPTYTCKCLVFLMDLYLSKLPKYMADILYCRPKCTTPHDPDAAW